MPAIEIQGLTKRFGDLTVLNAIDLRIDDGERLAVLGPSGAGKSTLLRILAGTESPESGCVRMDGLDTTRLSPDRRGLALMSQDYALYPQLSVRGNLETALLSLRLDRTASAARCATALQWFRIEHLSRHLPSQLSGGQAQRVALAKALIRQPRWLLLDEPFSQLDGPLREELRELVWAVVEHYQTSLMFVTHDPLDAMRLATQVAILSDGHITQVDSPTVVYQSPTTRIAAELMSPWGVNWLQPNCLTHCGPSPLLAELSAAVEAGGSVGFRPEAVQLEGPDQTGGDGLRMPVQIEQTAFVGFAQLLQVSAGESRFRCLVPPPMAIAQRMSLVVPASALLRIGPNRTANT